MNDRPRVPPPRSGPALWLITSALTVALPGLGHLYAQFIARGMIWLAGNIAILLILGRDRPSIGAVAAVLVALRVGAAADLAVMLRAGIRR